MVLTAYVALSPVIGLFCHRRQRIGFVYARLGRRNSAKLDASVGASGPHDFAVRCNISRPRAGDRSQIFRPALRSHRTQNAAASTAPHPAFVTIAIRPLCGTGWREFVEMIYPTGEVKYFCKWDWTAFLQDGPSGKSLRAHRGGGGRKARKSTSILRPIAGGGLPPLANVDVDIQIDRADAVLRRTMRAAFMPPAFSHVGIFDVGEFETSPLRQASAALTGKLPGQHDCFTALVGADDVRTQFAMTSLIAADHLLLPKDGVAEEIIGGARHRKMFLLCSRECATGIALGLER